MAFKTEGQRDPSNVIFTDIETAPVEKLFVDVDPVLQKLFLKKFEWKRKDIPVSVQLDIEGADAKISPVIRKETNQELWDQNAALQKEFCKIKAISVGQMAFPDDEAQKILIKVMYSEDEQQLMQAFSSTLDKLRSPKGPPKLFFPAIVAHNGDEFDFPILFQAFIQWGIKLPPEFDVLGKKPWERHLIDTNTLWGFGSFKRNVSLDLLAYTLGLASSKTILDGLNPIEFYYKHGLQQLAHYCGLDLVPTINAYRLMYGLPAILNNFTIFDGVKGIILQEGKPAEIHGNNINAGRTGGSPVGGENKEVLPAESANQESTTQGVDFKSKMETPAERPPDTKAQYVPCLACAGEGVGDDMKPCLECGGNGMVDNPNYKKARSRKKSA